jgi:hypothetical protein
MQCWHFKESLFLPETAAYHGTPTHPPILHPTGQKMIQGLFSLTPSLPAVMQASIEAAHDREVWSLAWHPVGHMLASGVLGFAELLEGFTLFLLLWYMSSTQDRWCCVVLS